ncbi:unnamed protein product [Kluyveromyces dobzhanskii CBS 2104]|uniref:Altered inheritance of mitochondria protein 41 n=1 Tax=Kluyveromyces dobzhanskii CBS 2104 TaxID=1427455 RepID=A0A0A8L3X3_9SACH|nr:unnamed protein product [Kluyveromyces dobzhanskii CBS 2104]
MFKVIVSSTRATISTRYFVRLSSSQAYIDGIALLKQDLKKAMLAKDDLKKTTIRGVLSTIKNKEIDSKDKKLDEFELYDVYSKLISQRKDSINDFIKNKREDLVEKEASEIKILESYLTALPVATKDEVDAEVLKLLTNLRETEPSLQLKQVFGKFDWKNLPAELRASPSAIRSSIGSQFKKVFQ